MRELFERIVRGLVDEPEAVRVRLVPAGSTLTILEITVAHEDIGCVIGKQGRTAAALRTLLTAMAGQAKCGRWQLEIAGERQRIVTTDEHRLTG